MATTATITPEAARLQSMNLYRAAGQIDKANDAVIATMPQGDPRADQYRIDDPRLAKARELLAEAESLVREVEEDARDVELRSR